MRQDATKAIIEFDNESQVRRVNQQAFEDHINRYRGDYGKPNSVTIVNVYTRDGHYLGSYTQNLSEDEARYYIPTTMEI